MTPEEIESNFDLTRNLLRDSTLVQNVIVLYQAGVIGLGQAYQLLHLPADQEGHLVWPRPDVLWQVERILSPVQG